eukprot:1795181-Pyramimonas_sp.AAC.1
MKRSTIRRYARAAASPSRRSPAIPPNPPLYSQLPLPKRIQPPLRNPSRHPSPTQRLKHVFSITSPVSQPCARSALGQHRPVSACRAPSRRERRYKIPPQSPGLATTKTDVQDTTDA